MGGRNGPRKGRGGGVRIGRSFEHAEYIHGGHIFFAKWIRCNRIENNAGVRFSILLSLKMLDGKLVEIEGHNRDFL